MAQPLAAMAFSLLLVAASPQWCPGAAAAAANHSSLSVLQQVDTNLFTDHFPALGPAATTASPTATATATPTPTPAPTATPHFLEDCFGDSSAWGVTSLSTLRQWQQEEFQAVNGKVAPRSPPYVYTLCPGNFVVTDLDPSTVIQPLLDQTVVACAKTTRSKSNSRPRSYFHQEEEEQRQQQQQQPDANCYIRSSSLRLPHVLLAPPASSSSPPGGGSGHHVRNHTTFMDLVFRESKLLSIAAWDSDSTSVSFVRCRWKDNGGFGLISNVWNGAATLSSHGVPPAAMKVHLDNCTLMDTVTEEDSSLSFLLASTGGTVTMADTVLRSNTAQVLLYGDSSHFDISHLHIKMNNAIDGFYFQKSTATIKDTMFRRNKFLKKGMRERVPSGSSIVAFDSKLNVSSTELMENKAFSDLIVQDGSLVSLDRVAFVKGRYRLAPAYVDNGNTIHTKSNILASAEGGWCRQAFFRGYRLDPCLTVERTWDCRGGCVRFPSLTSCEDDVNFLYRSQSCQDMPLHECMHRSKVNGTKNRNFWFCPAACGVCI